MTPLESGLALAAAAAGSPSSMGKKGWEHIASPLVHCPTGKSPVHQV